MESIFCFVTPFASPASVKHAEKLLQCLGNVSKRVYFVGDKRVRSDPSLSNIQKENVLSLHYLSSIQPRAISFFVWVIKLILILI